MPGLTAKFLRSAGKKSGAVAHTRVTMEEDDRSVSSKSSEDANMTLTGGMRAEGHSPRSESGARKVGVLADGLHGRASWREARKFLASNSGTLHRLSVAST